MAVGATKYFTPSEKTIPGPFPQMVKKIELYVKPGPQLLPVGKYSSQTFFQFSIAICYGNTGNVTVKCSCIHFVLSYLKVGYIAQMLKLLLT